MFARTYGSETFGIEGIIIDVEVDVSPGLPHFEVVGLAESSVKEAKGRFRPAIKNSGFSLQQEKVTINLAPADVRKSSPGLDLPMAVGVLAAYGEIPAKKLQGSLFIAELTLEGELRPVRGVLPMTIAARDMGFERIFVAPVNADEALLVDGIEVYAPPNLREVADFLTGRKNILPAESHADEIPPTSAFHEDFADVQGQFFAKRALEIAAAGGHNVLMVGSPGSGKTMLARRMPTILPKLSREEALEVTKIYSIVGKLPKSGGLVDERPFRSPHHDVTMQAVSGGGTIPRPGEVTLAHNGVLFLDELPEFNKQTLETLRQPLEDRVVTVSRVNATVTYPANIILICAMNPCPCGYAGDKSGAHRCVCSADEIKRYTRRISGPLLDRIDIHINVPRVKYEDLSAKTKAEPSAKIRERVEAARKIQFRRLKKYDVFCNAQINRGFLRETCPMESAAQELLRQAFERLYMSGRSHDRVIKVARTIADLAGEEIITARHISEAVGLRADVGLNIE